MRKKTILRQVIKTKVLLIGGYPRGHERPFDPATVSGKRLRRMVEEVGLDAGYLDLWESEQEERKGKIDRYTLSVINHHQSNAVRCVALGRWIQKCLTAHGITVPYLPHPASRRRVDREKLREGLEMLTFDVAEAWKQINRYHRQKEGVWFHV